jgi:hypothetical protein
VRTPGWRVARTRPLPKTTCRRENGKPLKKKPEHLQEHVKKNQPRAEVEEKRKSSPSP